MNLTWTDWPARRIPYRALLATSVMAVGIVWATQQHPAYGFLAAVVFLSTTADALFPTRYTLDETEIRLSNAFRRLRRPWSAFGQATEVPNGVYLQYASSVGWLAKRRSVLLRCPENFANVRAFVHQHLQLSDDGKQSS